MLERQMLDVKEIPNRIDTLALQFQQLRKQSRNELSSIRKEFETAEEETRRFMRMLHEDVLTRLKAIGEGNASDH